MARPDASGRLRTVWREGEVPVVGRAITISRRVAFETRAISHVDLPTGARKRTAFFPMLFREIALGVLEIQGSRGAIQEGSGTLATIACQLAGVLAGLAEREGLERELETLEGVAGIGRQVLRSRGPEEALGIVATALWHEFRTPVAIWWGEDHGPRTLVAVAGLNAQRNDDLERHVGSVLPGGKMTFRRRVDLSGRFSEALGVGRVTIQEAGDALVFVANTGPLIQRRVEMIATLLDDTLPLLSASTREEQRASRFDVGLAWTAHELRTPILGVKAALESVVGRAAPRDEALLMGSVRELEKLATDTEGILGWATGRRALDPRLIDVAQLVEDAVATYHLLHGPEGTIVVDAASPAKAPADPTHLRAAVVNLVRNAVIYSEPDSVVTVRVADEGAAVRVSVHNEGAGIPVGERGIIFDAFVRGGAGSRGSNGSGLGLFITRRVVEAHGGRIWVDPDEAGATFHMVLPVDGRELQRTAS
ncbi:MAG: sensor histidine kinase [Actinomycetota bacterium]